MMDPDYAATVALARRGLEHISFQPDIARIEAAISRRARHDRIRAVALAAVFIGVAALWIASMLANPISLRVCSWVTRELVFRTGIVHVAVLLASTVLAARRDVGAQIFARASWWSALLAATCAQLIKPGVLPWIVPSMAVSAAVAIVWSGDRGLEPERFRAPFDVRFHRHAMVALVILSLADVQSLAMATLTYDAASAWRFVPLELSVAALMAVAMIGLFRLALWGLIANLAANIVVLATSLTGVLVLNREFGLFLAATAGVQIVLALPLFRSVVRGSVASTHDAVRRPWLRTMVVGALVATTLGAVVSEHSRDPDCESH